MCSVKKEQQSKDERAWQGLHFTEVGQGGFVDKATLEQQPERVGPLESGSSW